MFYFFSIIFCFYEESFCAAFGLVVGSNPNRANAIFQQGIVDHISERNHTVPEMTPQETFDLMVTLIDANSEKIIFCCELPVGGHKYRVKHESSNTRIAGKDIILYTDSIDRNNFS